MLELAMRSRLFAQIFPGKMDQRATAPVLYVRRPGTFRWLVHPMADQE
jgi:hypothetical protein